MGEQKRRSRTIGSAADLKTAGREYFIVLRRGDEDIKIAVRRLSVAEREHIEEAIPEPYPPRVMRPSGEFMLDVADQTYRTKLLEVGRRRRERRILKALGPEFFGGTVDMAEQLRILREDLALSPEDLIEIDYQLRAPSELTSEAVGAAEERLAPFAGTETDGSSD